MQKHAHSYSSLLLMAALSFVAMFILMYMMVDKYANVYPNLNQFYMAGMMTAPMILIELFLMRSMYPNNGLNILIAIISIVLLSVFIFCIRSQTAIGDKEFLKSMIPHHASALLMCNEAKITDNEIKKLCRGIISSQQSEIDWMKAKLEK